MTEERDVLSEDVGSDKFKLNDTEKISTHVVLDQGGRRTGDLQNIISAEKNYSALKVHHYRH